MTMALSTGLVSGLDTAGLIDSLIAAERAPQAALRTRLTETKNAASAYRTVNTMFLAVTAAAEALLKPETWTATKATSSASSVAVSAGATTSTGALSFSVKTLAATHSAVSTTRWGSTSTPAGLTSISVQSLDGLSTKGTVTLDGTESLTAVAAKINKDSATLGVTAAVVQTNTNQYALQMTATKSGADASFSLGGGETFNPTTAGANAELKVGSTSSAYSVYSATNTFEGVMAGATLTVSKVEDSAVTVTVASDPDSVATRVQTLVDAVNSAAKQVKSSTSNAEGSVAALKGDYSVSSLTGRLLDAVAFAVGTAPSGGSPAKVGLKLGKDGLVEFDKDKFTTALKETPDLAKRMISGGTTPVVTGIAGRLLSVGKAASDETTGTLVNLAKGQDSRLDDLQDRIDAWDLRLAKRKETLQRQYTAMETALSSLQNQSTWLAGQINSLSAG
jgi:flagellar capping protein FliD